MKLDGGYPAGSKRSVRRNRPKVSWAHGLSPSWIGRNSHSHVPLWVQISAEELRDKLDAVNTGNLVKLGDNGVGQEIREFGLSTFGRTHSVILTCSSSQRELSQTKHEHMHVWWS